MHAARYGDTIGSGWLLRGAGIMASVPFLTDLDSRAAIKGSRDPLGVQSIWTRLGRYVVGNLTTVSTSVRDFVTLLLGYHFAERVAADRGPGSELATFLKWEQLIAYARAHVHGEKGFRGTDRAHANLDEGSRVTLSDDPVHQILGNQKIYGLWGLYTVPARSSGLLDGDPARLTPPARELVEGVYLKVLAEEGFHEGRRVVELLRQPAVRIDVCGSEARLVCAVARLVSPARCAREREFYAYHLRDGGPQDSTGGRQRQLATLLDHTHSAGGFAWSPSTVAALAREARGRGDDWRDLGQRLERIRTCEAVLAPASLLFTHLLGLDGTRVAAIAGRLQREWGDRVTSIVVPAFEELHGDLGAGVAEVGARWIEIARAAAAGAYERLIELLVEQNAWVMANRGGAPWIATSEGRLRVRFRDEEGALPRRDDLPHLWRFSYFLDSLRLVAASLREG